MIDFLFKYLRNLIIKKSIQNHLKCLILNQYSNKKQYLINLLVNPDSFNLIKLKKITNLKKIDKIIRKPMINIWKELTKNIKIKKNK